MLCPCSKRSQPSVSGGAGGGFGLAERPETRAFPNAVCRADASGAHPLPGGFCGVCVVYGEEEVKPVGLTVFRNKTKRVADIRVLHVCIICRLILLATQKANEADETRQHTGFL